MGNKPLKLVATYHCLVEGADKIMLTIECWQNGAQLKSNSLHKVKAYNYAYGLMYKAEINPYDYGNNVLWSKIVNSVVNKTCVATFLNNNLTILIPEYSFVFTLFGVDDDEKRDPNSNLEMLTCYRRKDPHRI